MAAAGAGQAPHRDRPQPSFIAYPTATQRGCGHRLCHSRRLPGSTKRQLTTPHHNWRVIRDLATDESTLEVINDDGTVYFPDLDLALRRKALEWYSYCSAELNSVRGETLWERGLKRGDWSVRTVSRTLLTSTTTHFLLHAQLDAFEGERRVFAETWTREIKRDLV